MTLSHPPKRASRNHRPNELVSLKLSLVPVAARWRLADNASLRLLIANVLETLSHVHRLGFVHRDVRDDNILRDKDRFLLIDWEVAGRVDQPPFWAAAAAWVPPGTNRATPWQPWMDLWQLGKVMQAQPNHVSTDASRDFAQNLLNKTFVDAGRALAQLW